MTKDICMTARVGVREITRNFNIVENYEYVEIEDKKNHILKGLFVTAEYVEDVKEFLDKKIADRKKARLDNILPYVGMVSGAFKDYTSQEIKALKAEKYNG